MSFKPGDRVFAKIKGFSSWPARINPLPPDVTIPKGKVPVFFYGTYQVSFVPTKNVVPYEEFKEKWGKPKSNIQFMTALEEIESNPRMLMLGEDPEAESYLSQFYDFKRSGVSGNVRRRRGSRTTSVVRRQSPVVSTGSTKSDVTTTTTTETSDVLSTGGLHWKDDQHNNVDKGEGGGEESEPIDVFSDADVEDQLIPSAGLEEPASATDSAYPTDRQARRAARKLAKKAEKKALKKAVKREAKRMYKASKRAERRARREAKREHKRTSRQESEPLEPYEQRLARHSILDEDLGALSEAQIEVFAHELADPRDRSIDVRPSVNMDLDRRLNSECPPVGPGGRREPSRSPLTGSPTPRLAYTGSRDAGNLPSVASAVAAVATSPPGDYYHIPATLSPMELLTAAAELVADPDRPPVAVVGVRQAKRRHPASAREQSPASSAAKPNGKSTLPEGHKKSKPSATPGISIRTAIVDLITDSKPQHNCDPVSRLKQTCHELKGCLVRGHEQFQLAVKLLTLLIGVEVRLPELAQARELMDCVKKCRRYKLSSDVRDAAEKVLQHFQTIRSRATKEELTEAHMLLTSGLANNTGPSTKPVTPPPATANNTNLTQHQQSAEGNTSSGSPPLITATSVVTTTTTRAIESENLAADLEARVDDVLSRIRATEERMAATARTNANPTSTNSLQLGASTQPGGVVTVGHTIRASAVAAAAAHMHDEEDEEEVMLRVEQLAAFQAASRGGTLPATAELPPTECSTLAPLVPPMSPVSSSNDVDVDLDLDTRIEKLRTYSAPGDPPPQSSSTSSSSRRQSASGSAAAATATTNSNSIARSRLASRRDKLLVSVEANSSAGTATAVATEDLAATIEKDDELYDLLGV